MTKPSNRLPPEPDLDTDQAVAAIKKLKHPLPMVDVRSILDALFDAHYHVSADPSRETILFEVKARIRDGKLLLENRCWHCGEQNCFEHCNEAKDGKHVLDQTSAQQSDSEGIVDVECQNCRQSGSFRMDPTDINW